MKLNKIEPKFIKKHNPRIGLITLASDLRIEKDFNNVVYLNFDVREKEIAKQLNIQFQTTLVIYKNNKEVYRSLGELSKDKIYKAINSVI